MADRYRKKPVEIEAMQWDGTTPSATSVVGWIRNGGSTAEHREALGDAHTGRILQATQIRIDTLEGPIFASAGDWVIRGVQGEFYPCKPDIFDATYEPVVTR